MRVPDFNRTGIRFVLSHSVYHKTTQTDKYLHTNSQHHLAQNIVHPTICISEPENQQNQLHDHQKANGKYGYKTQAVQRTIKDCLMPTSLSSTQEDYSSEPFHLYGNPSTHHINEGRRKLHATDSWVRFFENICYFNTYPNVAIFEYNFYT